jgi:glycosyltransferase involved in cell wall biosynthesis
LSGSKLAQALLIHYLPSQNPGLDRESAAQLRNLESQAIQNCARLICTGSTIFRELTARHPGKPVFLCRPGVDDFFQPADVGPFNVGKKQHIDLISVANLLPDKGYAELLEALSNLETQDWTWHIAGSGSADRGFSEYFRSTALARHPMHRIRFHGVLDPERLAILLSKMDLFVNASRYESYGMALAEAVAVGLPALSTRTGDAAEMILDGDSGLLVPACDRPALQEALEKLIRNPELLARFRVNSRARPRSSWRNCFENFNRACDSIP